MKHDFLASGFLVIAALAVLLGAAISDQAAGAGRRGGGLSTLVWASGLRPCGA